MVDNRLDSLWSINRLTKSTSTQKKLEFSTRVGTIAHHTETSWSSMFFLLFQYHGLVQLVSVLFTMSYGSYS